MRNKVAFGLIAVVVVSVLVVAVVALFDRMRQRTDVLATGSLSAMRISDGRRAPDTVFEDAHGRPAGLARWRGQVVLVNLWGQWCAPCREELPSMAVLADRYAGAGLVVLAIAVDTVKNRQINDQVLFDLTDGRLEFYFDSGWALSRALGVGSFPTTVVYGRSGREIARLAGPADWSSREAQRFIDYAIGR